MAWQDEMILTLRVLVNDIDGVTYPDANLEKILVVAARYVVSDLPLAVAYLANASDGEILPDPTEGVRDESFINLVCLKAACILDRTGAMLAAKQAIYVKDGASAIDLRTVFQGKYKLLEKGWCAVYEDAKFDLRSGGFDGVAGAAVMSPFRLYSNGYHSGRGSYRDGERY